MERQLKVTGTGIVKSTPDLIDVTFRVSEVCKTYEETISASVVALKDVQDIAEKTGFKKTQVKTSSFNVTDENERYLYAKDDYRYRHIGYRYSYGFRIEFDLNNKKLGDFLYNLGKKRYFTDLHIDFTIKDKERVKKELLKDAVRDAKEKAEVLALSSGVELGDIVDIDYSFQRINFSSNSRFVSTRDLGVCEVGAIDFNPEDVRNTDTVTIIWNIR